ncbi:hypothetical protein AWB67_06843 [Caballeronia terrestris]|uniref:Uncharacterized protein n=1 Tax=Caballeronia terrestris TaxID=1226301 RepID=A0A158KV77_9BURK|nr:hypothetical protein AWB67_06843 [Caballeronia terrestris]
MLLRCLRTDHRLRVERMPLVDRRDALQRPFHESVVNLLFDQHARRTRAHLALIQREHREAFERLVEEAVVFVHHVGEEDIRAFAAQFERHRNQVLACVLHDEATGRRLTGERDLRDALVRRQRLACFQPEAVHHVQHARRQQILDQFDQHQQRGGRLLGGFQHHAVACGERRSEFPRRHQDREIPGNDLPDHAQRFMEVIRDGVLVNL